MKNSVVKALLTFAVCGTLAGVMAPSVAQAETCSKGHEMHYIESIDEGFSIVNQFDHNRWGYDIYWCSECDEVHHVGYSITEGHDMCWNSDMTALVCECGYEEKW